MIQVAQIKADFRGLAEKYCGRWVALHPDTEAVLAHAYSAPEAIEIAKSKGCAEPLVFRVFDNYGAIAPCLAQS